MEIRGPKELRSISSLKMTGFGFQRHGFLQRNKIATRCRGSRWVVCQHMVDTRQWSYGNAKYFKNARGMSLSCKSKTELPLPSLERELMEATAKWMKEGGQNGKAIEHATKARAFMRHDAKESKVPTTKMGLLKGREGMGVDIHHDDRTVGAVPQLQNRKLGNDAMQPLSSAFPSATTVNSDVLQYLISWPENARKGMKSLLQDMKGDVKPDEPRIKKHDGSGVSLLPAPLKSAFNSIPPRVRGLLTCNALVLLVATNWVVVKEAGEAFDPFLFASMRFGVAALALSPFLLKALKRPDTLSAGLELGVLTAVGYLAQSQGLITTDASRASFLSTFTVIVVPLLAGINGHGVKKSTWVAAMMSLFGVFLLEQSGAPPCMGDVWSIVSAVAFGFQIFRTEHWTRELGQNQGFMLMSVVLATTAILAAAAAAFSHMDAMMHAFQDPWIFNSLHVLSKDDVLNLISSKIFLEIIYTSLLTTDVVLIMELMALQDISSTEAAIIYTLEPVLGAAFAFAVFGERWSASGWIGAGMIVAACLGMQLLPSDNKEDAKNV